MALACHHFTLFSARSERSEGSVWMGLEMLRCAQHDRVRLLLPLMVIPATPYSPLQHLMGFS